MTSSEAEPDEQTDAADGEPRQPGQPARRGEDVRRQEEDAAADDAVDADSDAVDERQPARH